MSKYLVNKFLFTIDRDPELVERYREDPAGTVAWWEREKANEILNLPSGELHGKRIAFLRGTCRLAALDRIRALGQKDAMGSRHRGNPASPGSPAENQLTRAALMPDQGPPLDRPSTVRYAAQSGKPDLWVHPLGAATRGLEGIELAEIALMRDAGARAVATGRRWIADSGTMLRLLRYAAMLGLVVVSHAEDAGLVGSAVATAGEMATRLGLPSAPAEAEALAIARDIALAEIAGARLHFRQVTTAAGLALVRAAKARGVAVTAGVSPAHFMLSDLAIGDFVVGSFMASDGTCEICRAGYQSRCIHVVGMGSVGTQAEYARVPWADGTLVKVTGDLTPERRRSLLAASDVLGTGWFAAVAAEAGPGKTVAVVGDGAVGLCGILAARQLGAERIIAMSRHADRQELARRFGATDIVEERGDAGVERIKELTGGYGAHSTIEAVGTQESMQQAMRATRAGGHVGFVGVSHDVTIDGSELFYSGVHLHGGPAPVRRWLPDLVELIMTDAIDPGVVFDLTLPLDEAAEGYRAMDERRATKVLLEF